MPRQAGALNPVQRRGLGVTQRRVLPKSCLASPCRSVALTPAVSLAHLDAPQPRLDRQASYRPAAAPKPSVPQWLQDDAPAAALRPTSWPPSQYQSRFHASRRPNHQLPHGTAVPAGEIDWTYNYIASRYGNPSNAWAFWNCTGQCGATTNRNLVVTRHNNHVPLSPAKTCSDA
jgi:hypothetical protein